jgi:hypothetical protein
MLSNSLVEVLTMGRCLKKCLGDGSGDRPIKVQVSGSEAKHEFFVFGVVLESGQNGGMQREVIHAFVSRGWIWGLRLRFGSLSAAEISLHWSSVLWSPRRGVIAHWI